LPELPEVETVRRGLEPVLVGHVVTRADVRRPDLRWPFPDRLAERLEGTRVETLGRRSKYLLAGLDRGETLIVHLGMSGRILVSGAQVGAFHHAHPAPEKHDHLVLDLDGGARVTLNDARRFGAVDLWPSDALETHRLLAGLGPEPLGNTFDADYLASRLAGRITPVKAVLIDQRVVAGLGNIYVCEALWRARVSPLRLARDVSPAEAEAIVAAVRAVLLDAIEAGGSSLRDYRRADGELGYFQHSFAVYGREGEPCPRCDGTVARVVQSGRSSFFCPACQD
jgi:formamidopyrimidine-DNA glycosylase